MPRKNAIFAGKRAEAENKTDIGDRAMEDKRCMKADEAFFKLLRLGIGTCRDPDVSLDEAGWAAVYDMACKQAVAGIAADGVECLPAARRPPRDILMRWIGLVRQTEACNQRLNRAATRVCGRFGREGMGVVLLKGQGNALYYPRPLHRTSGDIDLWVDGGRKAVVDYVRKYCPDAEVIFHHAEFPVLKDTEIELHFMPSWMNVPRTNARLQRCFGEWKAAALSNKVRLPGEEGEVAVPTLAMNRVYLLVHILRHFFEEGIGLRQLLDYHFVLAQPCREAGKEETARILERLHLTPFAGAVAYVLQAVFGTDDGHLPVPPSPGRGRRLLDEIMKAGNFGMYDERIRREATETASFHFRRRVSRNMRFLADYPGEVLWSPLFKIWHYGWRFCHGYLRSARNGPQARGNGRKEPGSAGGRRNQPFFR